MTGTDKFYHDFLKDLGALDDFLDRSNEGPTPEVPVPETSNRPAESDIDLQRQRAVALSRYDPDVRRLLEAVAFFSSRTRRLAVSGLQKAVDRVNAGNLDFLLTPMPATTLVRVSAKTNDRLKFGIPPLPVGTEFRITTPTRAVGYFSTTRPLKIWPLTARTITDPSGKPDLLESGGFRLKLKVESSVPTTTKDTVDSLCFHVNYRNDYPRSRRIASLLEHGLKVVATFDDDPTRRGCQAYLGRPRTEHAPELDELEHPLSRVRSFFHFPSQDLFLNVKLPSIPATWRKANFYLEVEQKWPDDLVVSEDTFRLFVVPVVNLRTAPALPIVCDGTKESYPIRGSNPAALGTGLDLKGEEIRLHSVAGVYKVTARGFEPLQSALLAAGDWAYEVDVVGEDPDRLRHNLLLQCPEAFESPQTISVEGKWYQPKFDTIASGQLTVELQRSRLEGTAFALASSLREHKNSPYFGEPMHLLHVLGLRGQKMLSKSDLMNLLAGLGLDAQSEHAPVIGIIADISAREVPETTLRTFGMKVIYDVATRPYPPEMQGLVDDFGHKLHALLAAWLPCAVEVRVAPQEAKAAELPDKVTS